MEYFTNNLHMSSTQLWFYTYTHTPVCIFKVKYKYTCTYI